MWCKNSVTAEHLGTLLVEQPEGQQRIIGLLDPADPGHGQRGNIPDRGAVFWHPNLRGPPQLTTRHETRSAPPRAVVRTGRRDPEAFTPSQSVDLEGP